MNKSNAGSQSGEDRQRSRPTTPLPQTENSQRPPDNRDQDSEAPSAYGDSDDNKEASHSVRAPQAGIKYNGIPSDAKWTKINRSFVNPAALRSGGERFDAGPDFVKVHRVLSKEEIQAYIRATKIIRGT
jgi:hypothetical protein